MFNTNLNKNGDFLPPEVPISKFSGAVSPSGENVIIEINVHPQSKNSSFAGFDQWRSRFDINVQSPPKKGKANQEVISVLSVLFNIPKKNIEIISGKRSSSKRVLLSSIELKDVLQILEAEVK
jgi:uncharacterized protein (TIGR00251 family)